MDEEAIDRELVRGLRGGDPSAFQRTYTRYRARLYAFLLRMSGRKDVAEDLLQETWMKVARAAKALREETTLRGWLFTVARNAYLGYRRWALLDITRIAALGAESEALEEGPETQVAATARLRLLERALSKLSPASREVLLLVGAEGMSPAEAATVVGLADDALRQRLSRARAELARRLEQLEAPPTRLPTATRHGAP